MTERQGAYTLSTQLYLTAEQRVRLERLVRDQRADPADLVSMFVADQIDALTAVAAIDHQGLFAVPIRLYLTPVARERVEQVVHEHSVSLADLVSWVVGRHLDELPAAPPLAPPPSSERAELQRHRAELGRLRARRDALGRETPEWLHNYITDLEAEIRRLEAGG